MDLSPGAVARALAAVLPASPGPANVERLSRGYSWITLKVGDVIVRIAPEGGTLEPYDPEAEADALRRVDGVVPAPRVLAVQPSADNPIGRPFGVHSVAPGEVLRLGEVTEHRDAYRSAMATTLGDLHRLDAPIDVATAYRDELERTRAHYERAAPQRYLAFEAGVRWLEERMPACDEPAVWCHGDYRFANVTWVAPGTIGAVLDWERAWPGDPMADVAFTRRFSGWCAIDRKDGDGDAVAPYEQASGRSLDEARVTYAERFERVRSYTASMRGMRAYMEGRSDDPRLLEVGRRGEQGMAELERWC